MKYDITDTWLERDGTTYTIKRDTIMPSKEIEEYLTKILFKGRNLSYLIKETLYVAKSIIRSLGVRHRTVVLSEDLSATDYSYIWLATDVFGSTNSDVFKLSCFIGLAVHESSHILHTNNLLCKKQSERINSSFYHRIWNIVEDERIEFLTCLKHPGYARFLADTKKYYFEETYSKIPYEETLEFLRPKKVVNPSTEEISYEYPKKREDYEIDLFFIIIRYPLRITDDDVEYFFTVMREVKDALVPYPKTNEECLEASEKIYLYFCSYLGSCASPTCKIEKKSILKVPDIDLEEIEGSVVPYKGHYLHFERNDKTEYSDSLQEVQKYVPLLKSFFSYRDEEITLSNKHQKTGYLDASRIVEAAHGIDDVYENYTNVVVDKWNVVILADMSGSMSGPKIKVCREATVLLHEAFKDSKNTSLFIYGHTADCKEELKVDLHVYKEPGYEMTHNIGKISAMGNNRDGDAIELVADRVRTFSKKPSLMIVLSDGNPNAGDYYGNSAIEHTKIKVQEAEKKGFYIIQVAIENCVDSSRMFKHFVKFTDYSKLPLLLNNEIKKSLKKLQFR